MTIKISTQKDALKQINLVIHKIIKDSLEVEKATMTCEISNGKSITRIEIVSRLPNV
jgi:hypothetical protein